MLNNIFKGSLADILFSKDKREEILGVKNVTPPERKQIEHDANAVVRYSQASDYKIFSEEVWSRALDHLDHILDDKTPQDRIEYYRGALRSTLDLLRISYQARQMQEALEKEHMQHVSSAR